MTQLSALVELAGDKRPKGADKLYELVIALHDACTGGTFETSGRRSDLPRLMRIAATISKVSVELHRLKLWTPFELLERTLDDRSSGRHGPII
jgi:hypothetical protein